MGSIFIRFYHIFSKNRLIFFGIFILTVLAIIWLALRLRLTEDISKVLPQNEKVGRYLSVVNQSAFADQIILFIGPADTSNPLPPSDLINCANELSYSIRNSLVPHFVSSIKSRADDDAVMGVYDEFHRFLPIFLEEEDYAKIDSMTGETAIDRSISSVYKNLVSPAGFATREWLLQDPLGLTGIGMKKLRPLNIDESYRTMEGYIFSRDLKYLLLFITPAHKATESSRNAALLDHLDQFIHIAEQRNKGLIDIGYFGSAAISVANARQLKQDIWLTMSMAIVLLILFIGAYFNNFRVIPAIVLTTLMSAGISIAVLTLISRDLSAISLGFGAVLLGIAIAYAIHYLNHVKELGNPVKVLRDISLPIIMSSIISSGDFFTLLLVRSEAVRDLGLFAGFSILAAGLLTLIFLPHLTKNIRWKDSRENFVNRSVLRIASFPVEKIKWLPLTVILVSVLFFFTSRRVTFESDMTEMSYVPKQLKEAESRLDIISQYSLRSVFVITRGDNTDDALIKAGSLIDRVEGLKEQGLVRKYSSITSLAIPFEVQKQRIRRWNEFWTEERKSFVKEKLEKAAEVNGFKTGSFAGFTGWLDREFNPAGPEDLNNLHTLFLDPYISENDEMSTVTTILKVRQEDKPLVYEALKEEKESFIFDKQFLTSAFMEILNEDFNKLVLISMLIVFLVLLASYGRIELALISFIPMLIGWIWTLGIMGLLGIKLNIFNIIITSFVFGLGIDYALFSIQGMLQLYKTGRDETNAYRSSVLMDAMTTLTGLGVLIFAVHPALRSMAISAIIGICCVWFITWALEPVLFRWLVYLKDRKRPVPVTLKDFLFAILSLTIFVVGTILLLIYGTIIFKLFRVKKGRLKDWFHEGLMYSSRFLIYANFLSPKRIIDRDPEDLKKPAVVIANHQSHIDIALMLMLHPRLLELTNDRVQHSFLYGPLMKMAQFYPVSDGMDTLAEKLSKNVDEGYSVLIFPEGTRSPDEQVHRFHKGAFYLAEKLNIDILPVIIHGSGPVMTKGEYFLKAGQGTIKFLPRIRPDDKSFGDELLEKSRAVRRYMAEEYRKVAEMVETPSYFRERLIKNYLYKGPVLEWYIRVKVRMEKDYRIFHQHLPKKGHITDIGCGYGFMDYMLMFLSSDRQITGIDYDEEKIAVARNCPGKNERIGFISGDVISIDLPESDAFILSDVLHYMPEDEQEKVIGRCIEKLKPEGTLMIRDADRELTGEHRRTRLSEFFSTRIGFNRTIAEDKKLYFTSGKRIVKILEDNGLEVKVFKEPRKTSNIIFIARKKIPRER